MIEVLRLSECLKGREDARGERSAEEERDSARAEGVARSVQVKKVAEAARKLLIELSRSGKDKGEIPEEWFLEVVRSPYHEMLIAEDGGEILGMATVSVVFGAGIRKNAYLEDFVVSSAARGKGVGGAIWEEILEWAREKECAKLEFTSGKGREAAQEFYLHRGAEIYETNFFQKEVYSAGL